MVAVFLIFGAIIFSVKTRANFSNENSVNNPTETFGQRAVSAKTLYMNNCARCHGADGKGDTELGRLYDASDLTSRKVKKMSRKKAARIIQNGDGSMPSFEKKLSAKDISALVGYIRTL